MSHCLVFFCFLAKSIEITNDADVGIMLEQTWTDRQALVDSAVRHVENKFRRRTPLPRQRFCIPRERRSARSGDAARFRILTARSSDRILV